MSNTSKAHRRVFPFTGFSTASPKPEGMDRVREKALSEASYLNSLVAEDGKAYAIVLEMKKYPEDGPHPDPESEIAPKIREILGRPEFAGLHPHLVGGPVFHYDFDQLASSETPKFMGLCLVIQMVLLGLARPGRAGGGGGPLQSW